MGLGAEFDSAPISQMGEKIMDTNSVMLSIQILSFVLFVCLPFLARLLWREYDALGFTLFVILFWMISSFVAVVSVYTWTSGLAL